MQNIFTAAEKGDVCTIRENLPDNINTIETRTGRTLLHIAVANGHLCLVDFLIEKGADTNKRDNKLCTPLQLALEYSNDDIGAKMSNLLLSKGKADSEIPFCDPDPLEKRHASNALNYAVILNKYKLVNVIEEYNRTGRSAHLLTQKLVKEFENIFDAAQSGKFEKINAYLETNQSINVAHPTTGGTLLHYAIAGGHVSLVEFLIARGADINFRNKELKTPLELALEHANDDIGAKLVTTLITKGKVDPLTSKVYKKVYRNERKQEIPVLTSLAATRHSAPTAYDYALFLKKNKVVNIIEEFKRNNKFRQIPKAELIKQVESLEKELKEVKAELKESQEQNYLSFDKNPSPLFTRKNNNKSEEQLGLNSKNEETIFKL